ncbi:hypothetical protein F383_35368 [Gossypium arboreum]|uniref:Uncharacterized protein n=1 Tax=Gossypium arboreum TaxID=29729 RepID=A0A0B0MNZ6_GOSAR|nr:hypothetical protein F383_25749 [Gossypium arboreum]KHG07918.1 hypothetical protein F383_35368 [Gossypium arboreum]
MKFFTFLHFINSFLVNFNS